VKSLCSALAILAGLAGSPALAQFGIGITVDLAPPELPVYEQPPMPDAGYLWTPGYWAWSSDGYYWVPGTWVQPPTVGVLWTPAWWGWEGGHYLFHSGYWGPHVGFYGGVNYGFGYGGDGYGGGRWEGDHFAYNHTVNNFGSVHVTNVYNETVINNNSTHVSFNGGSGGVRAQPTQADREAEHDHHEAPTPLQTQHVQAAAGNPQLRAAENHGHPAVAAVARPAQFSGPGVSAAHGAEAPAAHPTEQRPSPQAQPHPAAVVQPAHPAQQAQPEARHAAPAPQAAPHPAPHPQPATEQPHPAPQAQAPHPQAAPPHPQAQPKPPAKEPEREEKKPEPHEH
jgi:hypothetical protein